jgi:hypothetical protein
MEEQEIERLRAENLELRLKLARAKNPEPVERPSLGRVLKLAQNACMELERSASGKWQLRMGKLIRTFAKLRDIWLLLTKEEWLLSDIFPPQPKSPEVPKPIPAARSPKRYPSLLAPNLHIGWWNKDRVTAVSPPS